MPDVSEFAATATTTCTLAATRSIGNASSTLAFLFVPGQRYSFAASFRTDDPGDVNRQHAYQTGATVAAAHLAAPIRRMSLSNPLPTGRCVDGVAPAGAAYVRPVVAVVPVAAADTGLLTFGAPCWQTAPTQNGNRQPTSLVTCTGSLTLRNLWLCQLQPACCFDHAANNRF